MLYFTSKYEESLLENLRKGEKENLNYTGIMTNDLDSDGQESALSLRDLFAVFDENHYIIC